MWLDIVRYCPVRLCNVGRGLIAALRGMFAEAFRGVVSRGGAGSCPVGSSGVWLCKVRRFMVRSCSGWAGNGGVGLCLAWYGIARHYLGRAVRSKVRFGMVSCHLVWNGEVQLGAVGLSGVLYCLAWSGSELLRCGVVWSVEALHGIVKFGPVKYCVAGLGVMRYGDVQWGGVWLCAVWHAKLLLRLGKVKRGLARCSRVRQALLRRHYGLAWSREVGRCMVKRCLVRFALVLLRLGDALLGKVLWSPVLQGRVRLGLHRYGV